MVVVKNDRKERPGESKPAEVPAISADEAIPSYDDLFSDEAVQRRFGALISQAARRGALKKP